MDELSNSERRALDAWEPMVPSPDFVTRVVAAKSAPRRIAAVLAAAVVVAAAAIALFVLRPVGERPLATVTRTTGAIESQEGSARWREARVGTELFDGDAVRTSDSLAELRVTGANAVVKMDRYSVLRFGGTSKAGKLQVELGAIELVGSGHYALDVGDEIGRASCRERV